MLVVTRRAGQSIYIDVPGGPTLEIAVGEIDGRRVRIAIAAPLDYAIRRDDAGPRKKTLETLSPQPIGDPP